MKLLLEMANEAKLTYDLFGVLRCAWMGLVQLHTFSSFLALFCFLFLISLLPCIHVALGLAWLVLDLVWFDLYFIMVFRSRLVGHALVTNHMACVMFLPRAPFLSGVM